jgi:predicted RNase H-like nuclease (RuvC/YqgF family)
MTVEDDREESELECAQKCADIKEAILGRCPCYKSEETQIEEKKNLDLMKNMIYNLTETLNSIELKNEELQQKVQTLESTVEEKAHRCKRSYNSHYNEQYIYEDC